MPGWNSPLAFHLWYMGVQCELQGQGHGTALVFHALEQYYEAQKEQDIPGATLVALNKRVAGFYADRFGFDQVEELHGGHIAMLLPRKRLVDLIESA